MNRYLMSVHSMSMHSTSVHPSTQAMEDRA